MVQKNFNKANECTDARLLAGVICLVPDKLYEKDKLDKVVHMGNQIAIGMLLQNISTFVFW